MPCLIFNVPIGYTVTEKVSVADIDTAVKILSSRKRRRYVAAKKLNYGQTVELKGNIWHCPHCNCEYPTTLMDNNTHEFDKYSNYNESINKCTVEDWGTRQLSLFDNENNELAIASNSAISGTWKCPKCHNESNCSDEKREVCIEYNESQISIQAEICKIDELMLIPLPKGEEITVQFPIYEVLRFNLESGRTYIELQTRDNFAQATTDITSLPNFWKKCIVYKLLRDNILVSRKVKHIFSEIYNGELPFKNNELSPDKYVLMTRFIGFPRRFYDAIPYSTGTYRIEQTFSDSEIKLHKAEDAVSLFKESEIPQCKSIKKIFLSNTGLLFYISEAEKLWKIINDVNHYRYLMERPSIFDVLSLLHQRPSFFVLLADYTKAKGAGSMVNMLVYNWELFNSYAMDYCTMNDTMKLEEQRRWKNHIPKADMFDEEYIYGDGIEYGFFDDEDIDHEFNYRHYDYKALFSVPTKSPRESIRDCVINGFSFSWLRNINDCYMVGDDLKNCLVCWSSSSNPVVAVKKSGKTVAAIEVSPQGVRQVRGYHNSDISTVPGLTEAYSKWLNKYRIKEVLQL